MVLIQVALTVHNGDSSDNGVGVVGLTSGVGEIRWGGGGGGE